MDNDELLHQFLDDDKIIKLVTTLRRTLTSVGVAQWLDAPNPHLGTAAPVRPIHMLKSGKFEVVQQAAESLVEGSYL